MNRKGINYDIGTYASSKTSSSRVIFDRAVIKREMETIKNDLHCTSVRISGQDIERLTTASQYALEQGLEVWFSPSFVDADEKEMLSYFTDCAKAAEKLRTESSHIIFVTGSELTFFMKGLVTGKTTFDRIRTFTRPWSLIRSTIFKGDFNKRLNAFLSKATALVRDQFHGQLSYASGPWESVDWSLFDIIGIDYYRDANNKNSYKERLKTYFKHDKPVVITEFGCCTYKGAENKGGSGWAIINRNKTPSQINGAFVRDESVQSNYLIEALDIFKEENVDGAFAFTFVSPSYPHSENPLYDLDMASFSIVKTYLKHNGETYADMPWEPKEAFNALAQYYSKN